jgi:hypothetical protein
MFSVWHQQYDHKQGALRSLLLAGLRRVLIILFPPAHFSTSYESRLTTGKKQNTLLVEVL